MGYGDKWRAYRRMFHQKFRAGAVVSYEPIQLSFMHMLLRELVDNTHNVMGALKT